MVNSDGLIGTTISDSIGGVSYTPCRYIGTDVLEFKLQEKHYFTCGFQVSPSCLSHKKTVKMKMGRDHW